MGYRLLITSHVIVAAAFALSTRQAYAQFQALVKRTSPAGGYVKTAENFSTSSGSTIQTTAFAPAPTAGNLIVCSVLTGNTRTISSVTDTASNTYTLASSLAAGSCDSTSRSAVYYAQSIATTATFKVTATLSGSNTHREISCHEFSGMLASPFDAGGSSVNGAAITSVSAGPVTSNYNKELIFSLFADFQTFNPTNGFTSISTQNGNSVVYKFVTPTGSSNITGTFSPANCYDATFATFRSK